MKSTKRIHSKNINPPDLIITEQSTFNNYILCLQIGNEKINTAEVLKTFLPYGSEIKISETGKPNSSSGIEFNSSSTDNASVLIVSKFNPVGIDMECIKKSDEARLIAENYFSKKETKILEKNFYDPVTLMIFWTRREAFLKMIGTGLIDEMKLLDFSNGECEIPIEFENVTELKFREYFVKTFIYEKEYIVSYCTFEDVELKEFFNVSNI